MSPGLKRVFIYLLLALFLVLMLLPFASCDVHKEATKSKIDTNLKDATETKRLRKGDSVAYYPKRNIILKDTTIYRVSKENTVLRTVYDSQGNISSVDCTAAQIEELTRRNVELEQTIKDKTSSKDVEANMDWVLYLVIGAVVIIMFAIVVFAFILNSKTKAMMSVLQLNKQ